MLWSVRQAGPAAASYVFGTMHVKDHQAYTFYDSACTRINECEALALELDLGRIDQEAQARLMQQSPAQSLETLLTARKLEKVRRFFLRVLEVDIYPLRQLSPLLISNLINERLLQEDHPIALDEMLWRYAKQQEKRILGIETYEEQLQVLQQISPEVQAQSIVAMAQQFRQHRRHLLRLTALYAGGNLPQLHKASKRSLSGMRYQMLYRRNELMAERIGEMINGQSVFCAIGAGHLYGGKGVLRLLKQQGFTVAPVLS
ncbi:MAG: TraB/GumN family protein [Phaeodactylibacter sp.]|uniref:TraB/GumN family protein n=1 Tax=Phaeodactylibacter sp. TaxID=1940289 RepID=UPI0032EF2CC8